LGGVNIDSRNKRKEGKTPAHVTEPARELPVPLVQ